MWGVYICRERERQLSSEKSVEISSVYRCPSIIYLPVADIIADFSEDRSPHIKLPVPQLSTRHRHLRAY